MNNDFLLKKSSYFYELPKELIAQTPVTPRDASRLLVAGRDGSLQDHVFHELPAFLKPRDVLVINESKVIPARLFARDIHTGSSLEILLLRQEKLNVWRCIVRPGKKAKPGKIFEIADGLMTALVLDVDANGDRIIEFSFDSSKSFLQILDEVGQMPLPPYITEKLQDRDRYQTVYAKVDGSAAAPTAGLHFTPELLERIRNMGVTIVPVVLHVGIGTFRPVKEEDITHHAMHSEYFHVPAETAAAISNAKKEGRRVIAVGTTSCRTLESAFDNSGALISNDTETDIFIYPGYSFRVVDALITNFHLPESTLIMLVAAFLGYDNTMAAYRHAVRERYKFFSFGDAMFLS